MNLKVIDMSNADFNYHTGIWFNFKFPKEGNFVKFGYARVISGEKHGNKTTLIVDKIIDDNLIEYEKVENVEFVRKTGDGVYCYGIISIWKNTPCLVSIIFHENWGNRVITPRLESWEDVISTLPIERKLLETGNLYPFHSPTRPISEIIKEF